MTEINNDLKIIELIQRVYHDLKKLISQEKVKTKKMNTFLKNHFYVSSWWIGAEDLKEFEVCFQIRDFSDGFSNQIDECVYKHSDYFSEDYRYLSDYDKFIQDEKFNDEIDCQYGLYRQRWYEGNDEEYGEPIFNDPEFSFNIPNFLLNIDNSEHIADFIFKSHFPKGYLEKGEIYQAYNIYFRLSQENTLNFNETLTCIDNLTHIKDEIEKGKALSKVFTYLGFETLVIDVLQQFDEFKILNNLSNPDLIAYSLYSKELLIVEEKPKFVNKDFQKLSLMNPIFQVFSFLGDPNEWRISMLLITTVNEILRGQITEISQGKQITFITHEKFALEMRSILEEGMKIDPKSNYIDLVIN